MYNQIHYNAFVTTNINSQGNNCKLLQIHKTSANTQDKINFPHQQLCALLSILYVNIYEFWVNLKFIFPGYKSRNLGLLLSPYHSAPCT